MCSASSIVPSIVPSIEEHEPGWTRALLEGTDMLGVNVLRLALRGREGQSREQANIRTYEMHSSLLCVSECVSKCVRLCVSFCVGGSVCDHQHKVGRHCQ